MQDSELLRKQWQKQFQMIFSISRCETRCCYAINAFRDYILFKERQCKYLQSSKN